MIPLLFFFNTPLLVSRRAILSLRFGMTKGEPPLLEHSRETPQTQPSLPEEAD